MKTKRLTKTHTEATTGEIRMVVASWFLGMSNTSAGRKLPQKRHKFSHVITLRFATKPSYVKDLYRI